MFEERNKYRIERINDKFVLLRGDVVLFEVNDPHQTYTDDSVISAGLSIFAGLLEVKSAPKE